MDNSFGGPNGSNINGFRNSYIDHSQGNTQIDDNTDSLWQAVQNNLNLEDDVNDQLVVESLKQLDPDILAAFEHFSLTDEDSHSAGSNSNEDVQDFRGESLCLCNL